jgi:hypothetical protein
MSTPHCIARMLAFSRIPIGGLPCKRRRPGRIQPEGGPALGTACGPGRSGPAAPGAAPAGRCRSRQSCWPPRPGRPRPGRSGSVRRSRRPGLRRLYRVPGRLHCDLSRVRAPKCHCRDRGRHPGLRHHRSDSGCRCGQPCRDRSGREPDLPRLHRSPGRLHHDLPARRARRRVRRGGNPGRQPALHRLRGRERQPLPDRPVREPGLHRLHRGPGWLHHKQPGRGRSTARRAWP